jgi:hypothetical protein
LIKVLALVVVVAVSVVVIIVSFRIQTAARGFSARGEEELERSEYFDRKVRWRRVLEARA